MGFFDKKYCDVCGQKIGLLGNRKLEDGNLCKDCAAKLSPWFSDRRHTNVADIKAQLEYREANKAKVASFNASQKYGRGYQFLFVDSANGNFAVCSESDLKKGNPDIIPMSSIMSCSTEDQRHETELKTKDKDGKMVSYNPPRWEISYDFYVNIHVDNPYFDDIRFKLNSTEVKAPQNSSFGAGRYNRPGMGFGQNSGFGSMFGNDIQSYYDLCEEIKDVLSGKTVRADLASVARAGAAGGIGAAAAAIGAAAGMPEIKAPFQVSDIPYSDWSEQFGTLYVKVNVNGMMSCKVTDMILAAKAMKNGTLDINDDMKTLAAYVLSNLSQQKIPTAQLNSVPELKKGFMEQMSLIEGKYGVSVTDVAASVDIDAESKAMLMKREQMAAMMGAAPAGMPFTAQAPQSAAAPMAPQSSSWTCPGCGAVNEGGKFCEYCGTKRP